MAQTLGCETIITKQETIANLARQRVKSRVPRTTPVGIYPQGASQAGSEDLAGNCWEWFASLYRPDRIEPLDGRDAPDAEGDRVVRGGSWNNRLGFARCAYRYRLGPDDFGWGLGFRFVLSLADSGS